MQLVYTVLIIPGEPDEGGYWVKVPALPGCVSQGETRPYLCWTSGGLVGPSILSPWSGRG